VPQADAASALELDRRITEGWLAAAPEVVVSHARMKDDAELSPSPLIASIEACGEEALAIPAFDSLREALHRARALERVPDGDAPPAPPGTYRGGTALFRDQAACPFRAFARYRLGSKPAETPQPGIDARARGTLVHAVLAEVWNELEDKARLDSIDAQTLEEVLLRAADAAVAKVRGSRPGVLEGRFATLERDRLAALARDWLAFEKGRGDFAVVATERKAPLTFGGITVNAKLDRLDRLGDGGHAVLDYKTGEAKVGDWLGDRPGEPQLPMYALAAEEPVRAIAFARVKPGAFEFCGLADAEGLLPKVKTIAKNQSQLAKRYRDWNELVAKWRVELDTLGREFAAGVARVDPKGGVQSCRNCDQQLFCRIAEKDPGLGVGLGADADADADARGGGDG
jgi:probable DNA repair protein